MSNHSTKSLFEQLLQHPRPVDSQAVKVGFKAGEHFEATFDEKRPKRRLTMDAPPRMPERPDWERNYTELRKGRLTALFWFKPRPNRKSSIWVVRCDCGRYEFRFKLCRWLRENCANDMCEICERELEMQKGPKSNDRRVERLLDWIEKMRRLGLTDDEITIVHAVGKVQTIDKTGDEIRHALKLRLAEIEAAGGES